MKLGNKKALKHLPAFSRPLLLAVVLFILAFVFLIGLMFFKIKSVYLNAMSGRQDLEYALSFAKEGNFSQASLVAERAFNSFALAEEDLKDLQNNFFIKKIPFLRKNLNDFKYLAQTARVLSSSAEKALVIFKDFEELISGRSTRNFLEFSPDDRAQLLKRLYESYPEMQGIRANIDLSLTYLNRVKPNRFLGRYSEQVKSLESNLAKISKSLDGFISFATLIPILSGYPQNSHYLILLQNNNELRPSGGFLGTYGLMELSLGDIIKLETHDIYHLDMPASLNPSFKVEPPEPLKKYLGVSQWFMRDANWSPDWTVSAKKILWFYEQELIAANRVEELEDFSGIIALNPRFITDLLYLSGPVEVGGKVYDKDNFIDVLQYETEVDFRQAGVSEWDRKLVIGDILQELKLKLFNFPFDRWGEIVSLFEENIARKNILVYLNNDYSQDISRSLKWQGEIGDSPSDYLMVVDANMAAFKTDRVMEKKIKYSLVEDLDGRLKAILRITYDNKGWFDWQTTRYRSFTRTYSPVGSTFLRASGLSADNAVVYLDQELSHPKNTMAGFISIEPGQSRDLVFEYYLPDRILEAIKKEGKYSLLVQKQPGANIQKFEASFNFLKTAQEVRGDGESSIQDKKVYWTNDLERDYYLEIIF